MPSNGDEDAPGQVRQRLHTDLADSQLELGYLIQHQDAHRGPLRGQGFALASAGWGAVTAAQGLLLSTQLDAAEAVAQLRGAERTAQALWITIHIY